MDQPEYRATRTTLYPKTMADMDRLLATNTNKAIKVPAKVVKKRTRSEAEEAVVKVQGPTLDELEVTRAVRKFCYENYTWYCYRWAGPVTREVREARWQKRIRYLAGHNVN